MWIWWILAVLSIIALTLFLLILLQLNKLQEQKSIAIRGIMRGKGTIVYKYDKINELISRKRKQLTLININ